MKNIRQHTWEIRIEDGSKTPDILYGIFPGISMIASERNGKFYRKLMTYDPLTQEQAALIMLNDEHRAQGIRGVSIGSVELVDPKNIKMSHGEREALSNIISSIQHQVDGVDTLLLALKDIYPALRGDKEYVALYEHIDDAKTKAAELAFSILSGNVEWRKRG